MSPDAVRSISSVHALLAWSSVATLAVAAGLLSYRGGPSWRRRLEFVFAIASTALTSVTFALGGLLDMPYRLHLRQKLFLQSRTLGWLFERKEHFAVGAVSLALAGMFALIAVRLRSRRPGPSSIAADLGRAATASYVAAALLAASAAIAAAVVGVRAKL